MCEVSILIVNYNTKALLRDCLNSIRKKTNDVSYEVIVVDNNSKDGSVQMVLEEFPNVRLIASEDNLGFGRGNNLGASVAIGKYLFLLNSDTVLLNDAIGELYRFAEAAGERFGACCGNLYTADGSPNHSYSSFFPSLAGILLYRTRTLKYAPNMREVFNHSSVPKRVSIVIGADLFITSALYKNIGGFDPAYFMYIEDGDISFRIHKAGYNLYNVPQAKIVHLQGSSSVTYSKLLFEISSYQLYFRKFHSRLYAYCYLILETLMSGLRLFFFALKGKKVQTKESYLLLINIVKKFYS